MSLQVLADFRVVDESEDWIVVDKAAPLIVHPANNKPEPTLLGGLENLLAFEIANGRVPAIITRLDRETSGLVLVAKHTAAARELGGVFERREAEKQYLAVVNGWPQDDAWDCLEPIARAGTVGASDIWVRQMVHTTGKSCATRFQVEKRFEREQGKFALVRCFPETGRMHQIRVHLARCGFPILGDKLYSGDGSEYLEWMANGWTDRLREILILPRHALHAARLGVPWDGEMTSWQADLPRDLADFVGGRKLVNAPGVVIWSRHD